MDIFEKTYDILKRVYKVNPQWFMWTGGEEDENGDLIPETLYGYSITDKENGTMEIYLKKLVNPGTITARFSYEKHIVSYEEIGFKKPEDSNWNRLYRFMQYLENRPNHATVELEQKDYDFFSSIGFVTPDGYISFNGKKFCLG